MLMNVLTYAALVHESVLDPAGTHARTIAGLWSVFLWVTAAIYVLVMVALVIALMRRGKHDAAETPRGTYAAVWVAGAASVMVLFALLTASILTGRAVAEERSEPLRITLTGRQWWWQIDYEDADPSRRITSANEITVPVGVPVTIHLHSSDVIHSFWVPSLNGKRDLIPGHDGTITILAERAGLFRGQCAEFCGVQHAKMALWVNAVEPAIYARWVEGSRKTARTPSTPSEIAGLQVFLRSPCPLCHTIQGTDASGSTAPDLTHLASRRSLGADSLPNTRAALTGWIRDAQQAKPGCQMPAIDLRSEELNALVDYLGSLQ
ncbi:MAG TPA: cytochrome c oxidase subunit II [Thermoanaerobaculia bacterium]|jgi:cytochrome c oxidase subunit 2|nr:cytochrome c oxidase subunit II [Thermoanaerobaculia bacterium]